ncbi:type II secretion system protein [Pseudomonas fluorescens]|uniref:type II secretion system protein n=1 Tax=Pseudomonas TaxID=286 RepID=UPI0015B0AB5A|nr:MULTISPECIES: type II secretion system protein [Pseudomonas]MBD8191419.1 type II secretion system protein [Pseudomonas fluorescens]MBD8225596.1 type II secretion system protein [Pseudomonas fluorescens]MBD8237775.1 type II secretion system protein [Pseudomonas fluorescens]MBD8783168.1 type II secretion system protein [Pseudomonas fluorescens]MBD8816590.1 type II secretion system protein [Pseudomonas fluorescens]
MPTGKHNQHGSVFMGMLVTVAVVAVMLMEAGTLWSSVMQRERELELLARGNEIRRAIGLYYAAGNTFPKSLEDLVLDRRQPTIKRYLRRAYADPLTGSAEWGVIAGPGDTLMGVFSKASGTPFKQGNFAVINQSFTGQGSYQGWVFLFGPGQNNPATRIAPTEDQLTR